MSDTETIKRTKHAMAQCLGVHPSEISHARFAGRISFWVKEEPTEPVFPETKRPSPVLHAVAFC